MDINTSYNLIRTYITLLLIFLFFDSAMSQSVNQIENGNYLFQDNLSTISSFSIEFSDTNFHFRYENKATAYGISNNGEYSYHMNPILRLGAGSYKINDSVLYLSFKPYSKKIFEHSDIKMINRYNDSVTINIRAIDLLTNDTLIGSTVTIHDDNDNQIVGGVSDINGVCKLKLKSAETIGDIKISFIGYSSFLLRIGLNYDYNIDLFMMPLPTPEYIDDATWSYKILKYNADSLLLRWDESIKLRFDNKLDFALLRE